MVPLRTIRGGGGRVMVWEGLFGGFFMGDNGGA